MALINGAKSNIFINVTTNAQQTFDGISGATSKLRGVIAGLGVGLAALKFAQKASEVISMADSMQELAEKTGYTASEIRNFKFIAEQNGVQTETLAKGMRELSLNMVEAQDSSSKLGMKFKEVGVNVTDANGKLKTSNEVFLELSDKFATYEDDANKTALAAQLFGTKAGPEMLALLSQGSEGIREQQNRLKELGIDLNPEVFDRFADGSNQLNDRIAELGVGFDNMTVSVLSGIMPALNIGVETLTTFIGSMFDASESSDEFTKRSEGWIEFGRVIADSLDSVRVAFAIFREALAKLADVFIKFFEATLNSAMVFSKTLRAMFSSLFEIVNLFVKSLHNLSTFNFGGLKNNLSEFITNVKSRWGEVGTQFDIAKGKNKEFRDSLKNVFSSTADYKSNTIREMYDKAADNFKLKGKQDNKGKTTAPGLSTKSGGSRSAGSKSSNDDNSVFNGQIQEISNKIKEEEALFKSRQEMLDTYKSVDLISETDYLNKKYSLNETFNADMLKLYEEQRAKLNSELDNKGLSNDKASNILKQISEIDLKINEVGVRFTKDVLTKPYELQKANLALLNEELDLIKMKSAHQIKMIDFDNTLNDAEKKEKIIELLNTETTELEHKLSLLKQIADTNAKNNGAENKNITKEIMSLEEEIASKQSTINEKIKEGAIDLKSGFKDALGDVINGTKTLKESFRDLFGSIAKQIGEMALNDLFNNTMNGKKSSLGSSILGMFGGGGGGGLTSYGTNFGSQQSSMLAAQDAGFGGGGGGGGLIGMLGSFIGGFFAEGGNVLAGNKPIMVGEKGPELWLPKSNGHIINNKNLAASGGKTEMINVTIVANDPNSFRNSEGQIGATMYNALQKSRRNN